MSNEPENTQQPTPKAKKIPRKRSTSSCNAVKTEKAIGVLGKELAALRGAVDALSARVAELESLRPADHDALTPDDIRAAVSNDPYTSVEVIEDWKHASGPRFRAGQTIRADGQPHLALYVQHGLKVRVPRDIGAKIDRLKEEAAARLAAAEAKAKQALAESTARTVGVE